MADSALISQSIAALGAGAAEARERAAGEIFSRGRDSALAAIADWISDPEIEPLFAWDEKGNLKITVGAAVTPETFERIRSAAGTPRLAEVPPDQDAKEFELHFPGGASLDILTTRDPRGSGAIARFLAKFGEGIQQVEFLVSDIDRISKILRAKMGVSPVYPATRPGADGTRVNFILVPATDGQKVLIELVEDPAAR